MSRLELVPSRRIEKPILIIRGERLMLDTDLADLYAVSTKALNQAVKRNPERFPRDFAFRLTRREKLEVVTHCDHLRKLKFSPVLPLACTEHGALMLASVLRSPTAIQVSIGVVRAFIRLREIAMTHHDLARRLDALESKYDARFREVFTAIRHLMQPPPKRPRPKIGFGA